MSCSNCTVVRIFCLTLSMLLVYRDKFTKIPIDDSYLKSNAALPDHVYMDALGLGTACCALQCTIQALNLTEARFLYDQLVPLCPIMLAFTAASPIHRGFLTDVDCRWKVISGVTDCRTAEERGTQPLKNNNFVLDRCRYDSISTYLSPEGNQFNDVLLTFHEEDYRTLINNEVDPLMARHIAYLFTKEPIALYKEKIHQNNEEETDHYECINSTVWPTLRIKYPVPESKMGWRIEFRPCEIQITDFENTAILCFITLLSKVILSLKLNFLIPISKVDENMENAQTRNAIKDQKFCFRKYVTASHKNGFSNGVAKDALIELDMNQLFNGKKGDFLGLIPIIYNYLNDIEIEEDRFVTIQKYLTFIQKRASGEVLTTASWIRNFVTEHPEYSLRPTLATHKAIQFITDINNCRKSIMSVYRSITKTPKKLFTDTSFYALILPLETVDQII